MMDMKADAIGLMFGVKPDMDETSIHDRILELEARSLWIAGEMGRKENQSLDTCRHSKEMMESLEDEMHLLDLLSNVMYIRERIVKEGR